jgi:hypothetical protein
MNGNLGEAASQVITAGQHHPANAGKPYRNFDALRWTDHRRSATSLVSWTPQTNSNMNISGPGTASSITC